MRGRKGGTEQKREKKERTKRKGEKNSS